VKQDPTASDEAQGAIRDALDVLGIDDLLLGIHDRGFPGDEDDVGAGTPCSAAGRRFLGYVRGLGFTGVQLGPPGETSEGNPSPYDGTLFPRSRLSIALGALVSEGLVARATLERLVAGRPASPDRVAFRYAHRALAEALDEAAVAVGAGKGDPDLADRVAHFRRASWWWLERDALHVALRAEHGDRPWPPLDRRLWSPDVEGTEACASRRRHLLAAHAATIERHVFEQFVAHEQHRGTRAVARGLGLTLWGDLQVGFSERDAWAWQAILMPDYAIGAPPSRTNPEGQPWGYPVLDPAEPDAAERFVTARLDKMFAEYDGVRIDHPHGFVCPWVYRTGTADPLAAVQAGARLFASPDLADHPTLARFAIVGRGDLNPDPHTPRHADDWVVAIGPAQLDRYDRLMAAIVASARRHGTGPAALACEILSTCPYPLRRVLERHGLGRFRITQKANLRDPRDGYRSENAAPADWVMLGTHDTRPVWLLLDEWQRDGSVRERSQYLASRLASEPGREALARALAASPEKLAQAYFADLFAGPARHVMIFFTDAFGLRAVYNQGGIVAEDNWTLRLAPDYRDRYAARVAAGAALNLPLALAMALRARPEAAGGRPGLVDRLEGLAAR
jgi:4-alpha-glucanotransferase